MSLPAKLLDALDAMMEQRGLTSRSRLITELIRDALANHAETTSPDAVMAGTITLTYRSDAGTVPNRIAQKKHAFLKEVISSQHVFLENDQALEVLLVQGPPQRLNLLCDELRAVRGVLQVRLVTTAALLPQLHDPADKHDIETAEMPDRRSIK